MAVVFEKNKMGNYCLRYSKIQRVSYLIFSIILGLLSLLLLPKIFVNPYIIPGEIICLLFSVAFILDYFFEIELDETELIYKKMFKVQKYPYFQLKKYTSDIDFFMYIYTGVYFFKVSSEKYIGISGNVEKTVEPFLQMFFIDKLGIDNFENKIKESIIPYKKFKSSKNILINIAHILLSLLFFIGGIIVIPFPNDNAACFYIGSGTIFLITSTFAMVTYVAMNIKYETELEKAYYNFLHKIYGRINKISIFLSIAVLTVAPVLYSIIYF